MKWIRTGLVLGMFTTLSALGGWQAPHPGLTQMVILKDGLPLPECNPCPWIRPHGPTMPPDPGEPIL